MRYLEATVHQIGSELGTKGRELRPPKRTKKDGTLETIVVQIWISSRRVFESMAFYSLLIAR